jgi:hypothetical protein
MVANCGNLSKEDYVNTNNGAEYSLARTTTTQFEQAQVIAPPISVVIQHEDRFQEKDQQAATKNTKLHPLAKAGIVIVAAALLWKLVVEPAINKAKTKTPGPNDKDNGWQGGSGSSWPTGSGGGNVDGPKI